jgi:hypothetical protein
MSKLKLKSKASSNEEFSSDIETFLIYIFLIFKKFK